MPCCFINKSNNAFVKAGLGGWQVSGVMQFQTGGPFSVATGDDYLGIGSTNGKPWNLNGSPDRPKEFSNRTAALNFVGVTNFWFNPNVSGGKWATMPANGTLPNQNRNSIAFNNVGFQNWNLALFKSFRFAERHAVQFRAEGFNWLNHPNWSGVDTGPTSATFGMVTGKGSQRNLQLSLRYSF